MSDAEHEQAALEERLAVLGVAYSAIAAQAGERLRTVPPGERWSLAMLFGHLRLVALAYLAQAEAALAGEGGRCTPERPGLLSGLIRWGLRRRFRLPAPPSFQARSEVQQIDDWQQVAQPLQALLACARRATTTGRRGLRVKLPVGPARITIEAVLLINVEHAERHLRQAERLLGALAAEEQPDVETD